MPPRRPFDKKSGATTFSLLHRAQDDPRIHDNDAPSMVFAEKQRKQTYQNEAPLPSGSSSASGFSEYSSSSKVRLRGDLEAEFSDKFVRNEGQAAQQGVYWDDTQYDYMQHLRDLGEGQGTFVAPSDAASAVGGGRGKGKQRLEDALRDMDITSQSDASRASTALSLLPEDLLPSEFVQKRGYQDMQDVPDAIAGFQPDMDPRLREVLEALEDEAYVDDEEDIFGELVKEGREVEGDEWERLGEQQMFDDEDDAGWESDDTVRAASPRLTPSIPLDLPAEGLAKPPEDVQAPLPSDPTQGAWLDEFKKFNASTKTSAAPLQPTPSGHQPSRPTAPSALDASLISSLASGRRKKRKGAKTDASNYSMTSSALLRTDQQTLLDSRFDRIIEAEDEDFEDSASMASGALLDTASLASGMTGLSRASQASRYSNISGVSGVSSRISSYSRASDAEAPQLMRTDFDGIMDEFLGGHSTTGKFGKRVKKGVTGSGMEQLDEVRRGLGPARMKAKTATAGI